MADANFKISKGWIIFAFVTFLIACFLMMSSEVKESITDKNELIGRIDIGLTQFLIQQRRPALNGFAIDITALGSGPVLAIFILAFSTYAFFQRHFLSIAQLLVSAVGAGALTSILKSHFERARPDLSYRLIEANGFSYPSGHSLGSTAVYFAMGFCICQTIKNQMARKIVIAFFILLTLAIALSRVYLGVHYLSDVTSGIAMGLVWAIAMWFLRDYIKRRNPEIH